MSKPFWIVFDGPPEHESGHFVEIETAVGQSLRAGTWEARDDGYWILGPFVDAKDEARLLIALANIERMASGAVTGSPLGYCGDMARSVLAQHGLGNREERNHGDS